MKLLLNKGSYWLHSSWIFKSKLNHDPQVFLTDLLVLLYVTTNNNLAQR